MFLKNIVKDLNKLDKIGYQNLNEKELEKTTEALQ